MGPFVIVFWIVVVVVVAGLPRPINKELVRKIVPVEEIKILTAKGEKISVDGLNDVKLERNVSLCQNAEEKHYEDVTGTSKLDADETWTIAEEEDEENDGRKGRRRNQEEETERNWQKREETSGIVDDARSRRANELVDVRFFGMPIGVVEDLAKIDANDEVNGPKDRVIVKSVGNRFKTTKLGENEGTNSRSLQESTRSRMIEDQRRRKEDESTTKSDYKIEKEEASRDKVNVTSLKENNVRSEKNKGETEEIETTTMTKNEETSESDVEDSSVKSSSVSERRINDNSSESLDQNSKIETKRSEVKNEEEEPAVELAGRMFDETMRRPEESEVVEDDLIERNEDRSTIMKNNQKEPEESLIRSDEDRDDESNIDELQTTNYNVVESSKIDNEENASSRKMKLESQEKKKRWKRKKKRRKVDDRCYHFRTSHCRAMAKKMKSSISLISSNTRDDEGNEGKKCSYGIGRACRRHRKKSKKEHSRGVTSKKLCKLRESELIILRDIAKKREKIMGQCELRANREEDDDDDDDDDVEGKLPETNDDTSTKSILFSIASEIAIEIQPIVEYYEETDDDDDDDSTSTSRSIEAKVNTGTTDNSNSSHQIG